MNQMILPKVSHKIYTHPDKEGIVVVPDYGQNITANRFDLSPFTFHLSPLTFDLSPLTFDLRPFTFDLRPSSFELRADKFIIQRVLEYGLLNDWNLIKNFYGLPHIKKLLWN